MFIHRKWIVLSVSTVIMLILGAFSTPVRGVVAIGTPGGILFIPSATFIDSVTGQEYSLITFAGESEETAGVGNFTLQLLGPSSSTCSAHGGGADIGPEQPDGNFAGNFPLTEFQCGTAFGMAVSIDGCNAKSEMHGYSHSDYPLFAFMGPTTIDFAFRKSGSGGKVNIQIYTPKGPIKLAGNISAPVTMPTCP